MTASSGANFTSAFLHRAGLFTGILAIIAGILGMHVMAGTHSAHSPAAVTAAVEGTASGTGAGQSESFTDHTGHGTPAAVADPLSSEQAPSQAVEQCSCSGSCTNMDAMAASCIPSAKTGSLFAPAPGSMVLAVMHGGGAVGNLLGLWSYIPGTPSPGELSISRT